MRREPPPDADPQRPSPELLLWAYARGVFPMADPVTSTIEWYSPDPRGIIPLDAFHVPRNLERVVRRDPFEIVFDRDFERVMRCCAAPRPTDRLSWIDDRLIGAYRGLHERGHAHSVEAWIGDELVGGLYGVQIGAAFFGESMFVRPEAGGTNASKVALVHLVRRLQRQDFSLLDTQFWNPHLAQFGCTEIPRARYLRLLDRAVSVESKWT